MAREVFAAGHHVAAVFVIDGGISQRHTAGREACRDQGPYFPFFYSMLDSGHRLDYWKKTC